MHADISRPQIVDRHSRVLIENSAATVSLPVHQNFDELIRRRGGGLAQPFVVEGQDVAFRPERVVGRT